MFGGSIGSPQRTNGGSSFGFGSANVPAFGGGAAGFGNMPRGAGAPVRATTTPATTPDYSKLLSSYDYDCIVELIKEFESPEVLAKLCALEACLNKFFKLWGKASSFICAIFANNRLLVPAIEFCS